MLFIILLFNGEKYEFSKLIILKNAIKVDGEYENLKLRSLKER